jgi:hypothetical protein
MSDAEAQVAGLFAKFEPATARLGKALRARLRARLPGLSEVVYFYGNQHALVISYSPTGNGYDGLCSLSLRPDGGRLYFPKGALLAKADPKKLLTGPAKGAQQVALGSAADLDRPEIDALIAAAVRLAKVRLDARAEGAVILRVEAQKQRARRAAR